MDLRRSFVSYAAAWALIVAARTFALPSVSGDAKIYLMTPPLTYVVFALLAIGSTWVIAPRTTRGWWIVRYGLAVVLAWLLVTLAMAIFPAIDPALRAVRGEPALPFEIGILILHATLLWVLWLMIARPNLARPIV
jgi:hypothetical protein